jgi:UDP-glucose 4-epimerase
VTAKKTSVKRCCVVGGAGFIGSHLVEALLSTGREVTVLDKRRVSKGAFAPGVRYIHGDYGKSEALDAALGDAAEVVDLAYATFPKTSYENPVGDILHNLPPSVRLLEAAGRATVRKMVVVSSGGTVYGKAHRIPIDEDHPTHPISPYGITKLALEKYALMFHQLRDLPVVVVRPANAYGEGQRPFIGQGFIATAMGAILLEQAIVVFGEKGTVRDYVHADDVARGIIAALDKGRPGSAYNIGSGIGRSNCEVLEAIERLVGTAGFRIRIKTEALRTFDVPINVLSSEKLHKLAGWEPKVTWENGLSRTWDWVRLSWHRHSRVPA